MGQLLTWKLIQPGKFKETIEVRGAQIRASACKLSHLDEKEFNRMFKE